MNRRVLPFANGSPTTISDDRDSLSATTMCHGFNWQYSAGTSILNRVRFVVISPTNSVSPRRGNNCTSSWGGRSAEAQIAGKELALSPWMEPLIVQPGSSARTAKLTTEASAIKRSVSMDPFKRLAGFFAMGVGHPALDEASEGLDGCEPGIARAHRGRPCGLQVVDQHRHETRWSRRRLWRPRLSPWTRGSQRCRGGEIHLLQ